MFIVKIGGGDTINLEGIIADLAELHNTFIIVHGANALRDRLASKLSIQKKVITSLSGFSSVFSDDDAIDLIIMAYAGLRNKRIVEICQRIGINAIGLSGLDGGVIRGKRNNGIRYYDDGKVKIMRDNSGKPVQINTLLLNMLLKEGYTPILSIPIFDENNHAINSENDDIVTALHRELNSECIVHFIEAPGVLRIPEDPASLVAHISREELATWEQNAQGRFKRKMHALRSLFEYGSPRVLISDGRIQHPMREALLGHCTVIC